MQPMSKTHPVRIVVDSSTCLSPAEARELGITVVPMRIVVDGRSYRDLIDISPTEFYRSLREARVQHTTSAPTPGDYLEAFQASPGDVLCLTVASSISSMYQAANSAAGMALGHRIEVVDSGTAAGGLRLLAEDAARTARSGCPLEEIARRARQLSRRIQVLGVLGSLEHIARSGRIPQIASWGTSVLRVMPLGRLNNGRLGLVRLVRGWRAALQALEAEITRGAAEQGAGAGGKGLRCTVFHADALEVAQQLAERLHRSTPEAELGLSEFTPAMGVHTGPGLLGAAFFVDDRQPGE
jgi:DegV family protein with EDD domain